MSRFSGPQPYEPLFARGRNKGVQALERARRRTEAEVRDAQADPERHSTQRPESTAAKENT